MVLLLIEVELCNSLMHRAITETHHFVLFQNVFFVASVLAADTTVNPGFFIVEHIDVEVSHKAGRTSVI